MMIKPTNFAVCVSDYFIKHLAGTRNLSQNTIKSYRDTFCLLLLYMKEQLDMKTERISLENITNDVILNFVDWLETDRQNSISTRNQRLAAIHAFFRYAQMQHPEMLLQCQRILAIPMKKAKRSTVNYLSEDTIKHLLAAPDQTDKYGIRDAALLCLLYDSGARVQELIDLSLCDVRVETPATVRLLGKGNKVRTVPIMKQTCEILKKYLSAWSGKSTERPDNPLFINHQGRKLTRPGVTYILNKYATKIESQSTAKPLTPHILRHSKAMHLLRAGIDLHYIRDFLGHVYVETTEVYARADSEMKRKAFEKAAIELPNQGQSSWQKDKDLLSWLQSL